MPLIIKDAVKLNLKARIALLAPTGGGKTYSMLKFLTSFVKLGMAKKVGVVDTEHGSASKYVGEFPAFRVIELADDFSPEVYIEALQLLADDGCDAVGIDSLTHAWSGKGGSLELKDKFGRQKGFNDYTAWGPVSAMQNRLIEAMLGYPGHLVATTRLKMEHVIEKDPVTGKNVIRKIGLQPVQRDGLEYEFDLVGDLDQDHNFSVSKTRCSSLDGYSVNKPGEEVVRKLKGWLESGEAASARPVKAAVAAPREEIPAASARVSIAATQPATEPAPPVANAASKPEPQSAPVAIASATATATQTASTSTESPATALLAQIDQADQLAKLQAIATVVGTAHKAKAISDDDRRRLLTAYLARERALRAQVAA